jgi:DNA-binding protein YbaB
MTSPDMTGSAQSDDGLIRAVLAADGRLRELNLEPEILRRGQRGVTMDSQTLAEKITNTINAAYDDLVEQVAQDAETNLAAVEGDLERTAEDFERALEQISSDIIRAQRRLEP